MAGRVDVDCRRVLHRTALASERGTVGPFHPAIPDHRGVDSRTGGSRLGGRVGPGLLALRLAGGPAVGSRTAPASPVGMKPPSERDHAVAGPAICLMSVRGRLVEHVARCHAFLVRLFETIPPGTSLLCVTAGVGTLLFGLAFAIPFVVGVIALAVGHALDNYGLSSEDR